MSGFHGAANEECRFLGNKNPVHTSQETYYVYATVSSRLMLCNIPGFHGGDFQECRLLGCDACGPVRTNTSEGRVASTFRVKESAS
jgi:hypothetical protein